MRGFVAVIGLLALADAAPAQQEVVLAVSWDVKIAKVTNHLAQADIKAWCDSQARLYCQEFGKRLRFWKFEETPAGGNATLCFHLRSSGVTLPDLSAWAVVQLPGMDAPHEFGRRKILEGSQLYEEINGHNYSASTIMDHVTVLVNDEFLDTDFRGKVVPLVKNAWVAVGALKVTNDAVALPLPWERLSSATSCLFSIEDGRNLAAPIKGRGLSTPYVNNQQQRFLQIRPDSPALGLKAKRVYVEQWIDGLPPESLLAVIE
jgi:hypothetical protein